MSDTSAWIDGLRITAQLVYWIALAGLGVVVADFASLVIGFAILAPTRLRAVERAAPIPSDIDILIQVPVFNEPATVRRALEAAARLDWPRERLTIQLLDDSTDATTAMAGPVVERLRADGFRVDHLVRRDRTGFKAGALAAGLLRSDAPFVAMLDADFVASPDWLTRSVSVLLADPRAAFVQTRFEWSNGAANWLTRAQQTLVDSHFVVEQAARAWAGVPFQFNGTSGVWRRTAIADVGGWSAATLTEDLDLVLRAAMRGWHGRLLLVGPAQGEAPASIADWRVQQNRWSSGFMQVARTMLPSLWRSALGLRQKLAASLMLLVQIVFPCALGLVACLVALALLPGGVPASVGWSTLGLVICAILLAVGMTLPAYVVLRRGGVVGYVRSILAIPVMMGTLAVANSGAIVAAAFSRQRVFVRTPKAGH